MMISDADFDELFPGLVDAGQDDAASLERGGRYQESAPTATLGPLQTAATLAMMSPIGASLAMMAALAAAPRGWHAANRAGI